MAYLCADYIITPTGEGIDANLHAIRSGESRLGLHQSVHGERLQEPVVASLLNEKKYLRTGYTLFESLCIAAVEGALTPETDTRSGRCVFVLSSTKGDIWTPLHESAQHIAERFGNKVAPVVVSTACTSGVVAQLVAERLIESGHYDTAIVVGCDVQQPFIVSGFQCFKALSKQKCKPFDAERDGLNAGEAVACMVLTSQPMGLGFQLLGGAIHNDANHISGPSRTAEGSLRCLQDVLPLIAPNELAMISVHGTGTVYNDEMESIAIHRAGLENVPVTALKGIYGHTMGAAGLMETILSLHALEQGEILPTAGYCTPGTTYPVCLSSSVRHTDRRSLVKLLSGFGGVNAAVAWSTDGKQRAERSPSNWHTIAETTLAAPDDLVALYRKEVGDYPKFFKMDLMSRTGFLAVERLKQKLQAEHPGFTFEKEQCALLVASHSASLKDDTDYAATIADPKNYYPSPALFVYTLPNIVTGEIAIRHGLYGETLCLVLSDEEQLWALAPMLLPEKAEQALIAWVECPDKEHYTAHIQYAIRWKN